MRPVRRRGFDRPFSSDQITSSALHPIVTAYFCVISGISLPTPQIVAVLVPYAVLQVALISLWVYLGRVDPAEEGGFTCKRKAGQNIQRYCPSCRKTISGFDHHCSWLNTCIGRRNYAHFYALTVVGLLVFTLQTVLGILAITLWNDAADLSEQFGSAAAGRAAWCIHNVAAFAIAACFASLSGFHTYLLVIGKGTYDWIVDGQKRRDARRVRRQAKRAPLVSNGHSKSSDGTATPVAPGMQQRQQSLPLSPDLSVDRSIVQEDDTPMV